ncbi:MAG: hypothetical protein WCY97_08855 [Methanothrix sp.]|nr:hypothetical protein [Methanothrix sp.]
MRDHYRRPEVRETILRVCRDGQGDGLRGLNGDEGWYKTLPNGKVRLRGPEDYDDTTAKSRSLYITADVFEPVVFEHSEDWVDPKGRYGVGRPAQPIGTRGNLMAYTLFADIDAVADPADNTSRSKIFHEGRKEAIEAAAQYLVDHLKEHGVSKSVHVAFSGQGIYVMIHHSLSRAQAGTTPDYRDSDYKAWLLAFNALLADVERRFFEDHPEHRGRVKIDKLNNQKRKVKCVLSVHKTLDFAVVPLDPDKIEIDFEAAQLPLSDEVLERARVWYQDQGDDDERHALVELIRPYAKKVKGEIGARSDSGRIPRSEVLLAPDEWCPFYRNLLEYGDTVGKHRALGALAAWLYQAGWPEEAALGLWSEVAERANVDPRIFGTSYGVIHSPSCDTIQSKSSGYPRLGFGDLDVCRPDDRCKGRKWPGQYGNGGRKFRDCEELDRIEKALETVKDLSEKVKVDPGAPYESPYIEALTIIRDERPGEWERLRAVFNGAGISLRLLGKALDNEGEKRRAAAELHQNEDPNLNEEIPHDIRDKALDILETGDPIGYIMNEYRKRHVGDEKLGKVLILSEASSKIENSQGLQPKLSGRSGGGKTHACKSMIHLIPPWKVKKTSVSAKALYYLTDLQPGTIIFSDDIEMSPDLESTLKRSMTNYQEKTTHITLDKDREPVTKEIPERTTWWLTSVGDDSLSDELVNRMYSLNVEDGPEVDRLVDEHQARQAVNGQPEFDVTEEVLICRAIFQLIGENEPYKVAIPFSERIEFADVSDRRNRPRFNDLVRASAVMNCLQRETNENGELVASEADFELAQDLFTERAANLIHKLNDVELALAMFVSGRKRATMSDILAGFKKPNGIDGYSRTYVRKLLHGKDGKGGLLSKIPGVDCFTETDTIERDEGSRQSITQNVYTLTSWNGGTLADYSRAVTLKTLPSAPDTSDTPPSPPSTLQEPRAVDAQTPVTSLSENHRTKDNSAKEGSKDGEVSGELFSQAGPENVVSEVSGHREVPFLLRDRGVSGQFQGVTPSLEAELSELRTGEEDHSSSAGHDPGAGLDPIHPDIERILDLHVRRLEPAVPFVVAHGNGNGLAPGDVLRAVKAKGWRAMPIEIRGQKWEGWLPAEAWERRSCSSEAGAT